MFIAIEGNSMTKPMTMTITMTRAMTTMTMIKPARSQQKECQIPARRQKKKKKEQRENKRGPSGKCLHVSNLRNHLPPTDSVGGKLLPKI